MPQVRHNNVTMPTYQQGPRWVLRLFCYPASTHPPHPPHTYTNTHIHTHTQTHTHTHIHTHHPPTHTRPRLQKVDRGPFLRAAVHSKSTFWRKQRPELLKAAAHLIWARQRSQRSSTVHCKGTWDLCEALRALRSNPKLLARSNAST